MEVFKLYEEDLGKYDEPAARIDVVIADMFKLAIELAQSGKKVCLLNFANNDKPCAKLYSGNTQEEVLFRISDINQALTPDLYPIDKRKDEGLKYNYEKLALLFCPDVTIHAQNGPVLVDIITCAAIDNPRSRAHSSGLGRDYCYNSDQDVTARKLNMILSCAIASECDVLILGAWGCGAFNNPIRGLVDLWIAVLKTHPLKHVIFPLYSSDKETLSGLYEEFGRVARN